ncbi:MAG: hypothetical protein NXI00_20675 [Cytophagales bacterium]|nr:hypothetical protein [Cytophagales bacterium]
MGRAQMDRMYKKHLAKRITGTTLAKGRNNNGAVSVRVEPFAYGTFASWFRSYLETKKKTTRAERARLRSSPAKQKKRTIIKVKRSHKQLDKFFGKDSMRMSVYLKSRFKPEGVYDGFGGLNKEHPVTKTYNHELDSLQTFIQDHVQSRIYNRIYFSLGGY